MTRFDSLISCLISRLPNSIRSTLLLFMICGLNGGTLGLVVGQEPEDPTAPRRLVVTTRDRVELDCAYFPPIYRPPAGSNIKAGEDPPADWGHQVIPWILVHDWEQDSQDLLPFARQLQQLGMNAIIVPDLRGHGGSLNRADSTNRIDITRFRRNELAVTVNDIEACKRQLVQFNNDGQLNIDLLCLVTIGKSSVIGMTWTISDWFAFPVYGRGVKQAQDVKVLAMISPERKLGAWSLPNDALRHPMFAGDNPRIPNLPTVIIWSENDEVASQESEAIFSTMNRGRPNIDHIQDPDEWRDAATLYHQIVPRVRLNGSDLIRENGSIRGVIIDFVNTKVRDKIENHPWASRARQ